MSHGLGQVTDRGTGNRNTARPPGGARRSPTRTEIQIGVSGRNKDYRCHGRNTDCGLGEEQGASLPWQKYSLGSWEGTRSTPAMTEIWIRVLSPLPQEQEAGTWAVRKAWSYPASCCTQSDTWADMHKTWASMVAFKIRGLLSYLHILGAATHPRVPACDTHTLQHPSSRPAAPGDPGASGVLPSTP